MGALDHKAAQGPSQPLGSRNTRDVYSQMMLYRSRSPSPRRGKNELALYRGQAAKKGKSSVVSSVLARMAYKLERETLDTKLVVLGADDPQTILLMRQFAGSWYNQGLFKAAEELEVKIVGYMRETHGVTHSATLKALTDVALTWQEQGRYRESEPVQLEVFRQLEKDSGPLDVETLATLLHLASSWRQLGRFVEAEQAQRTVTHGFEEILGPQHPRTIDATNDIALTLSDSGRFEEATAIQAQVVKAFKMQLGPKHRTTIEAMGSLAWTWHKLGRYEEAESMQRQTFELQKEILGAAHPESLLTMHQLACSWHELGRYEESEESMTEVVRLQKEVWGESNSLTMKSIETLAEWQKQRHEREATAQIHAFHVTSISLVPSSDVVEDSLTTLHPQHLSHDNKALEPRPFGLPDELSDPSTPNMTANTALLSPSQIGPGRVYEIFDEEEDEQGQSERGRNGKAPMLLDNFEQGAESYGDEGGENSGDKMKGVECDQEAKLLRIHTEEEDASDTTEVTTVADNQTVPKAGEIGDSSRDARRDETLLSTGQASLHEELRIELPQSEENDDTPDSGRLEQIAFATLEASIVHGEPEAGEIAGTLRGRRLNETALSTPQDSAMHEEPRFAKSGENEDTSNTLRQAERPPAHSQAIRYRNPRHRIRKRSSTFGTDTTPTIYDLSYTSAPTSRRPISSSKPKSPHLLTHRRRRARMTVFHITHHPPSTSPHNTLHTAALLCSISAPPPRPLLHIRGCHFRGFTRHGWGAFKRVSMKPGDALHTRYAEYTMRRSRV